MLPLNMVMPAVKRVAERVLVGAPAEEEVWRRVTA